MSMSRMTGILNYLYREKNMNENFVVFELQAKLCQVLAHPLRLRIINTLKDGIKPVNEIVSIVDEAQSTVSRHLGVLRSAGVLETHRKGTEIFYEITSPKIVDVCELMRTVLVEREMHRAEIFNLI